MTDLTQGILKCYLSYEPLTGIFTWVAGTPNSTRSINFDVGYLDKDGYRIIGLLGKRYKAHRLAFLYMTGEMPKNKVDHKDGQPSNNVWTNLRETDNSGNQQNKRKKKNSTSVYFGVFFYKTYRGQKKYHAYINENGAQRLIGRYLTELEAHNAYCAAKLSAHTFQPILREDCKTNIMQGAPL